MCYAIARMDIRSRMRVAFVVERYALDEVGEAGRRTRAMVTALAARGHDVTVLTTCARRPDRWENECGEGKSAIDGVSVVRFRLAPDPNAWLRKPPGVLAPYHVRAGALWSRTLGPVCTVQSSRSVVINNGKKSQSHRVVLRVKWRPPHPDGDSPPAAISSVNSATLHTRPGRLDPLGGGDPPLVRPRNIRNSLTAAGGTAFANA